MIAAWRSHWPEYLMEGAGLAIFMVSAATFGVALFLPASPVVRAVPDPLARRALMGIAMGLTAVGLIHSPWGKRSGAHLNPAVTLTFWRLGKIALPDALGYVAAQFAGGTLGLAAAVLVLGGRLSHPEVGYVATVPGPLGAGVAFAGEAAISFGLMAAVLVASNLRALERYTGLLAGTLVALYITVESPVSGMSMNPARSFASALAANVWTSFWVYATAPILGMLAAAQAYLATRGARAVHCAKLRHVAEHRCIFFCRYGDLAR